ncbi:site-specific DNA-methyltransferase [Candidatus Woesearchaeota archaeon]|nr:site-specific DNA-methyltransferase [Candidatus Woesearchaeota archaeon]
MEIDKIYCKSSEEMREVDDESVSLVVTSPPYNININYGNKHVNGRAVEKKGIAYHDNREEEEYRKLLENVFNECKRVLKKDGSIWVNIKNRFVNGVIIPPFWLLDFFSDMYLKNIIIWNFDWGGSTSKRFSPRYEYVFWFTKSKDNYIFNLDEVKVPALNYRPDRFKSQMKNPSDVWYIQMVSGNYPERTTHPAQYPEELIERIVKFASNKGDVVLDPFIGSGTTARIAKDLERKYIGYDTEQEYVNMAEIRLKQPIQRKKKKSKDTRVYYWEMDNHTLGEFVKNNGRTR